MVEDLERRREQGSNDRHFGSWRVIVSAWALVLVFLFMLAGVSAVACLRGGLHPDGHLAGTVIPRHDSCGGLGIASVPGVDGCQSAPLNEDRSAYW
jgi:hypothetical protein